eukprot:3779769-Amphidinium_carterae.1
MRQHGMFGERRFVLIHKEDNELHHLLIMESLGGDQRWFDRFLAQHGAVAYYWILVGLVDTKGRPHSPTLMRTMKTMS